MSTSAGNFEQFNKEVPVPTGQVAASTSRVHRPCLKGKWSTNGVFYQRCWLSRDSPAPLSDFGGGQVTTLEATVAARLADIDRKPRGSTERAIAFSSVLQTLLRWDPPSVEWSVHLEDDLERAQSSSATLILGPRSERC